MTTTYRAAYAHNDHDHPGHIYLDASSDAEAVAEVKGFVESGYRNSTWATVRLSDGRLYQAENRHGDALCWYAAC